MSVHLVNPSDNSFGTAVITPRWLFVLAAATPRTMGDPILVDESIEQLGMDPVSHPQKYRRFRKPAHRDPVRIQSYGNRNRNESDGKGQMQQVHDSRRLGIIRSSTSLAAKKYI